MFRVQSVASLHEEILQLKEDRHAIILAHNYQAADVQDIADLTGDSLELSRAAATMDGDVIVFCGVDFMAETAAIISPEKTVLLPANDACCPMADMITADELKLVKSRHPEAAVVCYVNTTAEVKAESDICCTSSNAVKVVNSLQENQIIFVPDRNLGGLPKKRSCRGKDSVLCMTGSLRIMCARHMIFIPMQLSWCIRSAALK